MRVKITIDLPVCNKKTAGNHDPGGFYFGYNSCVPDQSSPCAFV
jgi:hypothetical protein